jgi:hypothetical protein
VAAQVNRTTVDAASGVEGAEVRLVTLRKEFRTKQTLVFNSLLDAVVAAVFLALVATIVLLSTSEWALLLSRRKPAVLRESEPVWLPDYAVAEAGGRLGGIAGTAALTLALAKELSGEAQLERTQAAQFRECGCHPHTDATGKPTARTYVEVTEERFKGVRRCC